jgi:hypothetical protein
VIEIRYSCPRCGIRDAEVNVRLRESAEDVVAWMKSIVEPALAHDHHRRSPRCRPDQLHDVKIPLPAGTTFIGGPVHN